MEPDGLEYRDFELRQDGPRRLIGTAITYGEVANLGAFREVFQPGAFGDLAGRDVILNRQHDRKRPLARTGGGGLELIDTRESLSIRAELPETRESADTLALVRGGVLRGLSVEFRATASGWSGAGVRTIRSAELRGIGVVDRGAYSGATVEARVRTFASASLGTIKGRFAYNKPVRCRCHAGSCERVQFKPRAFRESLESGDDIIAVSGRYENALASREKGALTIKETDEGLDVTLDLPDTKAARDLLAQRDRVRVVMRPYYDAAPGDFTEAGGLATYSRARCAQS